MFLSQYRLFQAFPQVISDTTRKQRHVLTLYSMLALIQTNREKSVYPVSATDIARAYGCQTQIRRTTAWNQYTLSFPLCSKDFTMENRNEQVMIFQTYNDRSELHKNGFKILSFIKLCTFSLSSFLSPSSFFMGGGGYFC